METENNERHRYDSYNKVHSKTYSFNYRISNRFVFKLTKNGKVHTIVCTFLLKKPKCL